MTAIHPSPAIQRGRAVAAASSSSRESAFEISYVVAEAVAARCRRHRHRSPARSSGGAGGSRRAPRSRRGGLLRIGADRLVEELDRDGAAQADALRAIAPSVPAVKHGARWERCRWSHGMWLPRPGGSRGLAALLFRLGGALGRGLLGRGHPARGHARVGHSEADAAGGERRHELRYSLAEVHT